MRWILNGGSFDEIITCVHKKLLILKFYRKKMANFVKIHSAMQYLSKLNNIRVINIILYYILYIILFKIRFCSKFNEKIRHFLPIFRGTSVT